MQSKEEIIHKACDHIEKLSGARPTETSAVGSIVKFSIDSDKIALDVFGSDNEPQYCMIGTEISGDDRGWYEETMFYATKPVNGASGYLIEGLYGRYIEYKDTPEAEFYGTYREVGPNDNWENLHQDALQRYNERTAEKLMIVIQCEVEHLANLTRNLDKTASGRKIVKQYRDLMTGSLRNHLAGQP